MPRFQPNWFYRILRNTAEVVGDTVVIHEPAQVVEVPAAPSVVETLGAAAAVVDMASQLQSQNAPVDRSHEMIALLSEIRDDMRALRANQAAPVVVVETPEPEPEPEPEPTAEVVVQTGDNAIVKEEIDPTDIPANEPPKARKRKLI
jgi:hypothetical protein